MSLDVKTVSEFGLPVTGINTYWDGTFIGSTPTRIPDTPAGMHTVELISTVYECVSDGAFWIMSDGSKKQVYNVPSECTYVGNWDPVESVVALEVEVRPLGTTPQPTTPQPTTPYPTTPLPTTPIPGTTGELDIKSDPSGATISLDNVIQSGITPSVIHGILPGVHQLKLSLTKYEDYIQSVTIVANQTLAIFATLKSTEEKCPIDPVGCFICRILKIPPPAGYPFPLSSNCSAELPIPLPTTSTGSGNQ